MTKRESISKKLLLGMKLIKLKPISKQRIKLSTKRHQESLPITIIWMMTSRDSKQRWQRNKLNLTN
jgi:hypothetical protein